VSSYKDLRVWQEAMRLVEVAYEVCRLMPSFEAYGLASQIRRASVSIPANIAEGTSRTSKKETAHFLNIAQGSAAELETLFQVAQRVGYVVNASAEPLTGQVRKMLSGLAQTYK